MKKLVLLMTVALVFALGGAVAFAGDSGSQSTDGMQGSMSSMPGNGGGSDTTSTNQQSSRNVIIQNFTFIPANITVPAGTTVVWTNRDSTAHTVTGNTSGGPMSGTLQPGQSYSFTFSRSATYNYHCSIHPMMTGTVIVTGSAASRTPAPATSPTPPQMNNNPPTTTTPTPPASTTQTPATGGTATNNNTNTNTLSQNVTVNQASSAKPTQSVPAQSQPVSATPVAATTQTPSQLPNTGAGGAIAAFVSATVLGSGLYYLYTRRRISGG